MTIDLQDPHSSTGTPGFDDILAGGLPEGRVTLLSGAPGTGKTLLSTAFACRGVEDGQGAVYASFEEDPEMLLRGVRFLGRDPDEFARLEAFSPAGHAPRPPRAHHYCRGGPRSGSKPHRACGVRNERGQAGTGLHRRPDKS